MLQTGQQTKGMDRHILSKIDEDLESSEVAALRFLCSDYINRKHLETVRNARELFVKLEEKGLLDNDAFISQLLITIDRPDLVKLLRTDEFTETDAQPVLSNYRVMLYRIHEEITQETLEKMKFLLDDKLGKRQTEKCNTALDVFSELEKKGLLSNTNLDHLYEVLQKLNHQLAEMVRREKLGLMPAEFQNFRSGNQNTSLCVSETQPGCERVFSDSKPTTKPISTDESEYYLLTHHPHGLCVIINNETFGLDLKRRAGTNNDARVLQETFTSLGFKVKIHTDLSGAEIKELLKNISRRNFHNEDALVVCVLSHGDRGSVYGSDEVEVQLRELTQPFTSVSAPSLAGKPKLFFIQACQGNNYQKGTLLSVPKPEEAVERGRLEEDAGLIQGETVPSDADFLLGMATVPDCKSFRSTTTGSIYIQELCNQLNISAKSSEMDDILTVLTRVNRIVSKGVFLSHKQMPEPKYTLTKKLVLRYV